MMLLNEVCDIFSGYALKSFNQNRIGLPVIKIGNINANGTMNLSDCSFSGEIANGKYLSQENDIYIALSGATTGKVALMQEKGYIINQRVGIVRLINKQIPISYLLYYLQSKTEKILSDATGVAQPNISPRQLSDYEFPDISILEMSNQANKLENIDGIIGLLSKQLSKLDELVKSRFIEMFGDCNLANARKEWIEIAKIGSVVGGATPKTSNEEFWDGEYRWITPAELNADTGYIYDSLRKLTKAGVDSCSLQELPINTVILSSRAPIGKVAIAGNTLYCNQGFKNIICNDNVIPRYLYSLLLLNTEYLNSLGRGATFKEISKSIVENIRIPVPPLDLQNQFAAFVEHTDKLKFEIKKSLEKLETFKKSLMQEYFG